MTSIIHDQPDHKDPLVVTPTIHPLVHLEADTEWARESGNHFARSYVAICRECGLESHYTTEHGDLHQAGLYARRHLGRHLQELAAEIAKFNR